MPKADNGGFIRRRFVPESHAATNWQTGFGIENAFTKFSSQQYRSTTNTVQINCGVSQNSADFTGIALINSNLTETALIKIKLGNDPTFTTFIVEKNMSLYGHSGWLSLEGVTGYSYLQLDIQDLSISEIWIGLIYLGTLFQFPHNYSWGLVKRIVIKKSVVTTDYGIHLEWPDPEDTTIVAPEYCVYEMQFDDVEREHEGDFKKLIMPGKKVFVPTFIKSECHYGIVPNTELSSTKKDTGDDYALNFWEDAITESLSV